MRLYYLNDEKIRQGVLGNLVLKDLGGGFQMQRGVDYDLEGMFGLVSVEGSRDLVLALGLAWVLVKEIITEPIEKAKPARKSKKSTTKSTSKSTPTAPPKAEETSVPTAETEQPANTTVNNVFALAEALRTIKYKDGKWSIPMPDGTTSDYYSRKSAIKALADDPVLLTYIQKLNQG